VQALWRLLEERSIIVSVNNRSETTAEDDVREWLDALDSVVATEGPEAAEELLRRLKEHARAHSLWPTMDTTTPYVNTIPVHEQAPLPEEGSDLRRKIKSLVRWNAMAMVVRANRESDGIGGHISTYASAATLYETAFNFFFRAKNSEYGGDQIYFQGHAAPGIYARAFLEGRLSQAKLENFRLELHKGGGLSSYPHPWLMPDFWQFPTVSMGLGPIMAIYQARFMRYLENRGLKPKNGGRVWAFLGDGECDEPESLGAIGMAVREKLDNLTFVINCNLQRLDGPVRGNGKIIQELEGIFQGAGWNVIKVIWGSDWDRLFAQDTEGVLESVFSQIPDGEFQKFTVAEPEYIRRRLTERDPRMKQFLDQLSDSELKKIKRGGHDPRKVYAAYHRAVNNTGAPTVILAKTVKGYGLGESGEGKNITHQQKKMNEEELRNFRGRFGVPISDDEIAFAPFYKPDDNNPAIKHMHELRAKLGGYVPSRSHDLAPIKTPDDSVFAKLYLGSERPVSTTMAFVQVLRALLSDKEIGKLIVPIVPDEARTFGMDGLFKQVGIYSSAGQRYDPVDSESLMSYREATDGQLLEEGINEAGSMSSFIAAGTAYSTHGINTIPFFIYYSMFGMQRIGDLVWAAGDSRCKGFLVGGTAGRTTLNGEGLQHQDGHSHILSSTVPNLISWPLLCAMAYAGCMKNRKTSSTT
jgi:pyruvate dehydrogenase E1 component